MESYSQGDLLENRLWEKVRNKIEQTQLEKTIEEIDYLNKVQNYAIKKNENMTVFEQESDFMKKLKILRIKSPKIW